MILKWFTSRTVRKAVELRQHVDRLVNEQRDLLGPNAIQKIAAASNELRVAIKSKSSRDDLEAAITEFIQVADQWLKPYPNPGIRDNVKEFFVAATVILSFTTFFLQLTKIPTGSMQPTLYGITEKDLRSDSDFEMPGFLTRCARYWVSGISYYRVTAELDGAVEEIHPPRTFFPFVKRQRIKVGGKLYPIWFPPDDLAKRTGLRQGQFFRAGEDIIRAKVISGDHLLVDRLTYNFRRPRRGEIIVFKTRGIPHLAQDQLYIKRMVALPGERVRILDDQHLEIDGVRLDSATPRFENVYAFSGGPEEGKYFGHVNQRVASRYTSALLSPRYPDGSSEQVVRGDRYLAMGDNTLNSLDSRAWGGLPEKNIIGKCWFVYWPFTGRFGWGTR